MTLGLRFDLLLRGLRIQSSVYLVLGTIRILHHSLLFYKGARELILIKVVRAFSNLHLSLPIFVVKDSLVMIYNAHQICLLFLNCLIKIVVIPIFEFLLLAGLLLMVIFQVVRVKVVAILLFSIRLHLELFFKLLSDVVSTCSSDGAVLRGTSRWHLLSRIRK